MNIPEKEYINRKPLLEYIRKIQGEPFATPLIIAAIENAPIENICSDMCCGKCKDTNDIMNKDVN